MEERGLKDKEDSAEKAFELLSLAKAGRNITLRDDQYDFPVILDSVKLCRQRGFRFRLIDSGKLDRFHLEWLGEAGADFYTSDEARAGFFELELVNKACKRGRAFIAYFHHAPLELSKEKDSFSFSELQEMGRYGIYLHITNRENPRDISQVSELAYACRQGGSWLVYYHHGLLEPSFSELGRNGAWIHVSDQSLLKAENMTLILDQVKSLLAAGAKLVVHLEKGMDLRLLHDIMAAGVFVIFKSLLFDYKSPFRILERKAAKRKLDFRAYYLYPDFLP
jgi:hypothetical protein